MERNARVFVAGHRGLLGRALVRRLRARGTPLLLAGREELDLRRHHAVLDFFERKRPDYVFLAAARVGGIVANQRHPVDFIRSNLAIELAVLDAAHAAGVRGLALFGSSCMYPREAPQPISEETLHGGPLEPTSRPYAVAKLAGLELCRAYRHECGHRFFTVVPATMYGPHDHFGSERAHVIPALLERFHRAQQRGEPVVDVLGSGRPRREFVHCDDVADAALLAMESAVELDVVNAGSGEEVRIDELAALVSEVVGYRGEIRFDHSAPDGAPRKLLDSSALRRLGWSPRRSLRAGIEETYTWYQETDLAGPDAAEGMQAQEETPFPTYS